MAFIELGGRPETRLNSGHLVRSSHDSTSPGKKLGRSAFDMEEARKFSSDRHNRGRSRSSLFGEGRRPYYNQVSTEGDRPLAPARISPYACSRGNRGGFVGEMAGNHVASGDLLERRFDACAGVVLCIGTAESKAAATGDVVRTWGLTL
jgi:hypothetical protein